MTKRMNMSIEGQPDVESDSAPVDTVFRLVLEAGMVRLYARTPTYDWHVLSITPGGKLWRNGGAVFPFEADKGSSPRIALAE